MNRDDLTALIDTMGQQRLEKFLEVFSGVDLTINNPPRSGLMMMTVKDSFDTDFHLGEVLVAEARVLFRGHEGYGMASGDEPRRALARAAADAVLGFPEPTEIGENLLIFLKQEEVLQKVRRMKDAALVAATKVNFDLMPGA
jgi:phosphonate C-P lyase system protein PhnG